MPTKRKQPEPIDLDPYQVAEVIIEMTTIPNGYEYAVVEEVELSGFTNKAEAIAHYEKLAKPRSKAKQPKEPTLIMLAHLLGGGRASVWEVATMSFGYPQYATECEKIFRSEAGASAVLDLTVERKRAAKRKKGNANAGVEVQPRKRIKPSKGLMAKVVGKIPA